MKQSASCKARLMAAVRAFEQRPVALRPDLLATTAFAGRLAVPAALDEIFTARLLGGEPLLELAPRLRKGAPEPIVMATGAIRTVGGHVGHAQAPETLLAGESMA